MNTAEGLRALRQQCFSSGDRRDVRNVAFFITGATRPVATRRRDAQFALERFTSRNARRGVDAASFSHVLSEAQNVKISLRAFLSRRRRTELTRDFRNTETGSHSVERRWYWFTHVSVSMSWNQQNFRIALP